MQSLKKWWYGEQQQYSPPPPSPSPPDVNRQLKIMRIRARKLDADIIQEQRLAKEKFEKNDKTAAVKHLKKSKMLAKQSQMLSGQISNLEQTQLTLEAAATNNDMLLVMKETRDVIQQQVGDLNIHDVDQLKDDLEVATDQMQAISEAFSTPIYEDVEVDDETRQQMAAWEQQSKIAESDEIERLLPRTPVRAVDSNNNNNNDDDEGVKAVNKNFFA